MHKYVTWRKEGTSIWKPDSVGSSVSNIA